MFNDFNFWVPQLEKAAALLKAIKRIYSFHSFDLNKSITKERKNHIIIYLRAVNLNGYQISKNNLDLSNLMIIDKMFHNIIS